MSAYESTQVERTELTDQTECALTEYMGVLPEGGDLFTVVGENHPDRDQSTYTVDLRRGRCSCADSEYREPEGSYKHVRRARFATGREPVPAVISPDDVAGELGGEHLDGELRFLATDGGEVAGDTSSDRSRVPVAGGVLVYEQQAVSKELVGVEHVTDWDALGDALAAGGTVAARCITSTSKRCSRRRS